VDQRHRASLLHGCALSQVLGASALGLAVKVAQVTPLTWPPVQRKGALAAADKLSLHMQQS